MGTIAPQTTTRDAEIVRGGSEEDIARLLRCGGRLVKRGSTLRVREMGGLVLQVPYALITIGSARQRVLVLLGPAEDTAERRRVVHHLP